MWLLVETDRLLFLRRVSSIQEALPSTAFFEVGLGVVVVRVERLCRVSGDLSGRWRYKK